MPRRKKQRETPENPDDMPVLRRLREAAGLTQAELAKRIPDKTRAKTLNQSVISRWESGEDEPELTIPQMRALCKALGIAFEDLPDDFGPPKLKQLPERQGGVTE
jgi:transcriptional regulator with XRE-family HTH domain